MAAGLLTVPTEIRLRIYTFLFSELAVYPVCNPQGNATSRSGDRKDGDAVEAESLYGGSITDEHGEGRPPSSVPAPDADAMAQDQAGTPAGAHGGGRRPRERPQATVGVDAHRQRGLLTQEGGSASWSSEEELGKATDPDISVSLPPSLLLTCRKVYAEARPVFLGSAKFNIRDLEEHRRVFGPKNPPLASSSSSCSPLLQTQPSLDALGHIHNLSITSSLLSNTPPSLLHVVLRNLTSFTVNAIPIKYHHRSLSYLELSHLHTLQTTPSSPSSPTSLDPEPAGSSPGFDLFRTLLCSLSDTLIDSIMAHFQARHGRYELKLQFLLGCLQEGRRFMPGSPIQLVAPHRHVEREVVYTFNAKG